MYTVLYCVALYLMLSRSDRIRLGSIILVSLMWILVTINTCILWVTIDYSYIRNGDDRETQLSSITTVGNFTLPMLIVSSVASFLSFLLTDLTMIWRCWVLYGRRWIAITIPTLLLIVGIVCDIFRIMAKLTEDKSQSSGRTFNWEIMFLSSTVLTNSYCTVAIIMRICGVCGFRKAFKTYRGILEILIEDHVMYAVVYIVWIGLQVHTLYFTLEWDRRVAYPTAVGNVIVGVAPTLVIARVAAGFARPDDSWTKTSLPRMGSAMRSLAESLQCRCPATDAQSNSTEV